MSKQTKFTPGPWVAEESCVYSDDVTGSIVSRCTGFQHAPRPDDEMEANAHLIAAAPEMYEALKEIESTIALYGPGMFAGPCARAITSALAKAEGRQP